MNKKINFPVDPNYRCLKLVFLILFVSLSFFPTHAHNNYIPPVTDEVSGDGNALQDKPVIIYIVDGKEMSAKEVDKLDQEKIEQMEFIKDKEKIRQYTDKDVETVVLITTSDEEIVEEEAEFEVEVED